MPKPLCAVLAMAALALFMGQAHAQGVPEGEGETPGEETESTIEAGAAAEEAGEREAVEGEDVTYAEVLRNPDDIELNFRFAQTQIRKGDLLGASATLERILLIEPDLPRVRVLYAIVLFRLDNLDQAARELDAVAEMDLPADLAAQIARYRDEIALRRKRTRFSILLSLGGAFETNRNAAPESEQLETGLGRAFLDTDSGRAPDYSVNYLGRASVEHDLGFQARHRLFGAVTTYHADQVRLDRLDLHSVNLSGGGVVDLAPVSITPRVYWEYLRLSHEPFLRAYGARLRVDWRRSDALNLYAFAQSEAQDYFRITETPATVLRTGPEHRAGAGAAYRLSPTMLIEGRITRIRKEAKAQFHEYEGTRIALDHRWLLGGGFFLLSHLSGEVDVYDGSDPLVGPKRRRDRIGRARVTLGFPLGAVAGAIDLPAVLSDVTVTVGAEYHRSISNITNFTYTNVRAKAGLTKRFDF